MAEDDEQPAEEAGGETEAASAWNILQSPAGKLVAAAGGGFVAYQCLRAASAIGDDARACSERREATPPPPPRRDDDDDDRDEEAAETAPAEVDDADEPVAVDDPKKIISRDLLIAYDQENPKRPGTNSHFRYEAYKRATSGAPSSRWERSPTYATTSAAASSSRALRTSYDLDADAVDDDGQHSDDECEPAAESGLYGRKRKQRTLFLAECASVDNKKLRRSATM
ncbi:hypothetical protein JL720_16054 [Aureococcus anophagefferens]|nr:hypothetical protein JL720_16054 [Aureococcus anophagefferens]